jgi:hypothetical protein
MPSSPPSLSTQKSCKSVYLVRHAESLENRRLHSLSQAFRQIGRFSLPAKNDVVASIELLNVSAQVDSSVSDTGERQIVDMARQVKAENFLSNAKIELVLHSPLLRARQTCQGIFGCASPDMKAGCVKRVLEVDLLAEKTPLEWVPGYYNNFLRRIENFECWLGEQPESSIVIVGHSQYFKAMLGLDFKFENCDVWKVTFQPNKNSKGDRPWKNPERIFECFEKRDVSTGEK